jgi:hypothetical protein
LPTPTKKPPAPRLDEKMAECAFGFSALRFHPDHSGPFCT